MAEKKNNNNTNNTNNTNNKDPFIASIDNAMNKLKSFDAEIKSVNSHIGGLKDSGHNASDGINELAKSLEKLDNRQTRKIETLTKRLDSAFKILEAYKNGNFKVATKFISKFTSSLESINKISIDTGGLDKLADTIDRLNSGLENFLKLSRGIDAVNFDKLMKSGISFVEPGKTSSSKGMNSAKRAAIKQEYDRFQKSNKYVRWEPNELAKAIKVNKAIPDADKSMIEYREYQKMLMAKEIHDNPKMSEDEQIERFIKFNRDVKQHKKDLKDQRKNESLANSKEKRDAVEAERQARKQRVEAEKAAKSMEELRETVDKLTRKLQYGPLTADQESKLIEGREKLGYYRNDTDKARDTWRVHEKSRQKRVATNAERAKAAAEAREDVSNARFIAKAEKEYDDLKKKIESGEYSLKEAETYVKYGTALGKYSSDRRYNELTDSQKRIAELRAERDRQRLNTGYYDNKYNSKIEQLRREAEERAQLRASKRAGINSRSEANLKKNLEYTALLQRYEESNKKLYAVANIIENTLGANSPIIKDLTPLLSAFSRDNKTINTLRLEKQQIAQEYNLEKKRIDNEELTERQAIESKRLTSEEIDLLNNPNLSSEQRAKILEGRLTDKQAAEEISKLNIKTKAKREKLEKETIAKQLENQKALDAASLKAVGSLTQVILGLQLLVKATSELYKISKQAAEANKNIAASLKSMGVDANTDSIKYFTNTLSNMQTRLTQIGQNIGNAFEASFAGWLVLGDSILDWFEQATDWIKNQVYKLTDFLGIDVNLEGDRDTDTNKQDINYKGVLNNIADKLDKGITVDGVEIVVDKATAYKALSSTFGQSKVQGFDNTSSANIASAISSMANQVQANYGVDYNTAMSQISDSIYNGSNAASAYGIVIDDQILAGYAAMEKELDIVNVEYTDAYLSALRLKLAQEMIAKGNSADMQKQIKEWKQLGDVIQTASGSLYDFQEVQSIQAKDFTIPEIDSTGSIGSDDTYKGYDKQELIDMAEAYDNFTVATVNGVMSFKAALATVGGDINQIVYVWDSQLNKGILATKEYADQLVQTDSNRYRILTDQHNEIIRGAAAIGLYAAQLGLTEEQLITILGYAKVSVEDINTAVAWLVAAKNLDIQFTDYATLKSSLTDLQAEANRLIEEKIVNIDSSQIDDCIKKLETALELQNKLNGNGSLRGGFTRAGKTKKYGVLSAYSQQDINKYEGSNQFTKALRADWDRGLVILGAKDATIEGYTKEDLLGTTKKYIEDNLDITNNRGAANIALKSLITSKTFGLTKGFAGKTGSSLLALPAANALNHATGGISTNAHLANISEGNKAEAIIPLESDVGINALSAALIKAGANNDNGVHIENLTIKNDGINIAENNNQWRKVASRIENEIATLQRERGGLNSGVK